jgi:CcmD family protein
MKPLLLAGYTITFGLLFAYVIRLERQLSKLEDRLSDLSE